MCNWFVILQMPCGCTSYISLGVKHCMTEQGLHLDMDDSTTLLYSKLLFPRKCTQLLNLTLDNKFDFGGNSHFGTCIFCVLTNKPDCCVGDTLLYHCKDRKTAKFLSLPTKRYSQSTIPQRCELGVDS